MYPLITLRGNVISMTSIAIMLGLITFLVVTSREAKRNKLQFTKLFYWLPLPLLAGYIGGLYVNFALYNGQLLPFSRNEFLMLISPYGFDFHPIGIVIGITIAVVSFMMTIPSRHEKKLWINVLSQAFCVSFIPFGLLLLMGDHFIGQPTTSIRGIETFRADISRWSELGSVYPIGAFVALLGTVGFFFQRRGHHSKTQGTGYLTLGGLLIGIAIILTFQHSPKYLVLQTGFMKRDISSYIALFIAMMTRQQFLIEQTNNNTPITTPNTIPTPTTTEKTKKNIDKNEDNSSEKKTENENNTNAPDSSEQEIKSDKKNNKSKKKKKKKKKNK